MSRVSFILLYFLTIAIPAHSQKQAMHWVFGGLGGLDFSCTTPQITLSAFDGLEGGASISSSTGELLFYTNGDIIWNKNHRIMPHGKGLGGLCTFFAGYPSSSQSAIIIPHPGTSNLYYVFTTDCAEDNFTDGLRYSIVDISLDSGRGDVITKNQPLMSSAAEKIAAIFKNDTSGDVWLVTHGAFDNGFYTFSITSTGLDTTPIESFTGQDSPGGRGYLKFSPDGNLLIANSFNSGGVDSTAIQPEIFTFNKTTGEIKSKFVLPNGMFTPYSASFSPDSKLLYVTCSWTCSDALFQYNLEAGTPNQIIASAYNTGIQNIYGAVQLGPDGKLYCLGYNSNLESFVNVIHNPNAVGSSCNAEIAYIKLPCQIGPSWGLPNFIESYFQTQIAGSTVCQPANYNLIKKIDFTTTSNCTPLNAVFVNTSELSMDLFYDNNYFTTYWDFGDGTNDQGTNFKNKSHSYSKAGHYIVTLSMIHTGCDTFSVQKEVIITDIKANFSFQQRCNGYDVEFKNTTEPFKKDLKWHWDFGDINSADTSNVKNPSHAYLSAGTYMATLSAINECTSIVKLPVKIYDPLNTPLGNDTTMCFNISQTISAKKFQDATYQWNNGSTDENLTVTTPGHYVLTVSRGNCSLTDTITFNYAQCSFCPAIENFSAGNDTTICIGDKVVLHSNLEGSSYRWNDGSDKSYLTAYKDGDYWIELTRGNCVANDTMHITTRDCEVCNVSAPNVFTPSGDLFNEEFIFFVDCDYTYLSLEIINQWGERVYTSSSPTWNGMIGGKEAPVGVYYYTVTYSFQGARRKIITRRAKSWIHLVR